MITEFRKTVCIIKKWNVITTDTCVHPIKVPKASRGGNHSVTHHYRCYHDRFPVTAMISWYKDTAVQFAKPWCMTCFYHLCHWRRKNTPVKTKKQDSCIHFTAVPLCVYHYYCYVLIQLHSSLVCFSLLSSILPLWVFFPTLCSHKRNNEAS